jgi:hypothetical protein
MLPRNVSVVGRAAAVPLPKTSLNQVGDWATETARSAERPTTISESNAPRRKAAANTPSNRPY